MLAIKKVIRYQNRVTKAYLYEVGVKKSHPDLVVCTLNTYTLKGCDDLGSFRQLHAYISERDSGIGTGR